MIVQLDSNNQAVVLMTDTENVTTTETGTQENNPSFSFSEYDWDSSYQNFLKSLEVMGLGMAGIFLVMGVLIGFIYLLSSITKERKE